MRKCGAEKGAVDAMKSTGRRRIIVDAIGAKELIKRSEKTTYQSHDAPGKRRGKMYAP